MTEQDAALLFTLLAEQKPGVLREIIARHGSFAGYFAADPGREPEQLSAPLRHYLRNRDQLLDRLHQASTRLREAGTHLLSSADSRYPGLLREIHRAPPLLYVKGDPQTLAMPQIAIVGSRHASRAGLKLAEDFAQALAAAGFAIVSGMALGIDGAAHRGALRTGTTVAVLGTGVEVVYPRQHRRLYDDILAAGGAVVSELPPASKPLRQYFPQRNRIISGLSLGVLIVEAALQSGSLITARLAMEQGREVFAVPGSIHNPMARGCHQLIREGAVLTETLEDMVAQLGGMLALKAEESAAADPSLPEDPVARAVLTAMAFDPVAADTLIDRLSLPAAQLTAALVSLEVQGFVEHLGGRYQRIR